VDSPLFPNTSALEALRILLACACFAVALWGCLHAGDGRMAFARPIRAEFVRGRREQMGAYLAIALMLGAQAVVVANVPESEGLPPVPAISGNLAQIVVLAILLALMLRRLDTWARHEAVMGEQPLVPDGAERLTEAARLGRPMIHAINNDLSIVVGTLDLLSIEAGLTADQHAALELAAERLGSASDQLGHLQRLVRALGGSAAPEGEQHDA
jgi:hypothetical protein